MNGYIEPLPGLLDDPQFAIPDLPALTEFHIAPLRNPAPLRHTNAPPPLEPITASIINAGRSGRRSPPRDGLHSPRRAPNITPNDVLLARESKKPHLAISELLENADGSDSAPQQLPSFVSLSVVEKSPIQSSTALERGPLQKRPRLDQDGEYTSHEFGRQLPRPAQKEMPHSRPAPLLPAMVTGLHEPPPSAALLPSMDPDKRPGVVRSSSSKIQVKDILREVQARSPSPSMLATNEPMYYPPQQTATQPQAEKAVGSPPTEPSAFLASDPTTASPSKDQKARRMRRKWTERETQHLLAGVRKHGVGKWKQILEDTTFAFTERSSVDLKDRYRVCSKDDSSTKTISKKHTPAPDPYFAAVADSWLSRVAPPPAPPQDSLYASQNKQRRKRRAWTVAEDDSLLKGVTRYGFQWTAIHDDPELKLGHRRATDLRDRIRNKFPDGYKHAESAPLRSDIKKAEKHNPSNSSTVSKMDDGRGINDLQHEKDATYRDTGKGRESEKEKEPEKAGFTLPSLSLDEEDSAMDWDNRLPPLLPWDEVT